jgi:rhamnosyltransferase
MPIASPKVAVLLAAYNGMAFIDEQVKSILQQINVSVTLFISVDLSSDGTYEWCCDFSDKDSRITVMPYGDKFGGAAPNFYRLIRDVDFSDYDYVALSDQDDIWLEDKLITACNSINRNDVHGYSSNVTAFWDDGRESVIDKAQAQRKYDYLFEAAGPGCTYVFLVEPLTKFKERMATKRQLVNQITLHDWLLYAFFRAQGYRWLIDANSKMRYRQHPSNQVGINKGLKAYLKRFELLKSGWYRQQVINISSFIQMETPIFNSRWLLLKSSNQLRRGLSDRIFLFFITLVGLY